MKESNAQKFGAYIKMLRKKKGWSFKDLEKETEKHGGKISNAYIYQIESNKKTVPGLEIIKIFSKTFDVPIEILLKEAGYLSDSQATRADAQFLFRGYEKLSPHRQELLKKIMKSLSDEEKKEGE